jgi:hypothetical protein
MHTKSPCLCVTTAASPTKSSPLNLHFSIGQFSLAVAECRGGHSQSFGAIRPPPAGHTCPTDDFYFASPVTITKGKSLLASRLRAATVSKADHDHELVGAGGWSLVSNGKNENICA